MTWQNIMEKGKLTDTVRRDGPSEEAAKLGLANAEYFQPGPMNGAFPQLSMARERQDVDNAGVRR